MSGLNAFTNYTDENGNHKPLKDLGGATGDIVTSVNGEHGDVTLTTPVDYSLNEVDTGIKWHNGKTIYRKTFYKTNPTPNTVFDVTGSTELIKVFGFITRNGGYNRFVGMVSSGSENFGVYANGTNKLTLTATSSDMTSVTLTVEYTK